MHKLIFAAFSLVTLVACQAGPTEINPADVVASASRSRVVGAVADQYIVVFKNSTTDIPGNAQRLTRARRGQLRHTYSHAIRGFAARIPADEVEALRADPSVQSVEPDEIVSLAGTQTGATWGLDRLDQAALPLNKGYTYGAAGSGVSVYVLDTGIRPTHVDFGGRAAGVFTAITDGNGTADCHGHGTHVAGTIAGATWGVAKAAKVYGVRVLGCTGTGYTSGIMAGVDWVTANAKRPAVANMSLTAGTSLALESAIATSIASGVTYVVAAGNTSSDACAVSPARMPAAITVGATTSADAQASYSNFGACIDIYAPGSSITSAGHTSDTQTAVKSGTSMASPHVAGVAALYLSATPSASPAMVASMLTSKALSGKVTSLGAGSPNRLLNIQFLSTPTPPSNAAPVARITSNCNGLTCTFGGTTSSDDSGVASYAWNMSGGGPATSSASSVSTTYSSAGTKSVSLTVRDAAGLASTATVTVTATAPTTNTAPIARITSSCSGLTCTFGGATSSDDVGITSYAWTATGGAPASSAASSMTTTYSAAGARTVSLTVRDAAGLTSTSTVTVSPTAPSTGDPLPVPVFTWSCDSLLRCVFHGEGSTDNGTIVAWNWTIPGSNRPTNAGAKVYATYSLPGTYTVTLTVKDNLGQTKQLGKTVTLSTTTATAGSVLTSP